VKIRYVALQRRVGGYAFVGAVRPTRFSTVPLAWRALGELGAGLLLAAYAEPR